MECIASIRNKSEQNLVDYWIEVYKVKNAAGDRKFGHICQLAFALLSLLISNSGVERVFSVVNIIKDKIRNKLAVTMVEAILHVRCTSQIECTDFVPTDLMLKRFNSEDMYSKPNIAEVVEFFIHICGDVDEMIRQWNVLHRLEIIDYWTEVYTVKNAAGDRKFGHICQLEFALLSLPISNAEVERVFSLVNIIKDKIRNKLAVTVVEAILHVRCTSQIECTVFVPTDLMLKRFTSEDMYSKVSESDVSDLEVFPLETEKIETYTKRINFREVLAKMAEYCLRYRISHFKTIKSKAFSYSDGASKTATKMLHVTEFI
ncbi:hypothetical protein TSAR_006246 [Trichomalopsis sarcophagae]|uniref:HAT C-terminal dimerisation domain-containing protein n=1 Tax=Trichomalopsis sarcophagae TaxID=543379 RepID=A0A232ELK9_9HYME|nr:hypothetical protein TSAR_006246 [Trichomalopsis sarcophagae]